MTQVAMTQAEWNALNPIQKKEMRNDSDLTEQLCGKEGWRVEVETTHGEVRRFIVGMSTGWRPCHLEVARRDSSGGPAAEKEYTSVKMLYPVKVR